MENKCTLTLGQFFNLTLDLMKYVFFKLSPIMLIKNLVSNPTIILVIVDLQMVVIQVQIGKNIVEDVLLDSGFGVNIIIEELKKWLKLPILKLDPYNLEMASQIIAKHIGLIKNLKIHVHKFIYIITFIIL